LGYYTKSLVHLVNQRRTRDLLLNIVFVGWVLHILVTGRLLPNEVVGLFRDEPPVAVLVEPAVPASEPSDLPAMSKDET
jgi:hypothetical protein